VLVEARTITSGFSGDTVTLNASGGFGASQGDSELYLFDPRTGTFQGGVSVDSWSDTEVVGTLPGLSDQVVQGVYCIVLLEGEEVAAKSAAFDVRPPLADWNFSGNPALPSSMSLAFNVGAFGTEGVLPVNALSGVPIGVVSGRSFPGGQIAYEVVSVGGGTYHNVIPGSTAYGTTTRIYPASLLGTKAWQKMGVTA
jgi:hypothetical protein